jgi:hypothetical protein
LVRDDRKQLVWFCAVVPFGEIGPFRRIQATGGSAGSDD